MTIYSNILCAGFAVGLLDFIIKFSHDWNELPDYFKGWSWHISVTGTYFLMLYLLYMSHSEPLYFYGLIVLINEDATYYLLKSIPYRKLQYNSWLHIGTWYIWKSTTSYYLTVIILNLLLLFVITRSF